MALRDDSGSPTPADRSSSVEPSPARRLHLAVASVVILTVLVAGLLDVFAHAHGTKLEPGKPVPGTGKAIATFAGIPQHGFALGARDAPVTLVEYADLKCARCAEFSEQALPALISKYVRTSKLRLVFRPLDLGGGESLAAARMAAALAEQDRLWQFAYLMYHNEPEEEEDNGYVTSSFLEALAVAIPEVDLASATDAERSQRVNGELARFAANVSKLGLTAAPAFLLSRTGKPPQSFTPSTNTNSGAFGEAVESLLARR